MVDNVKQFIVSVLRGVYFWEKIEEPSGGLDLGGGFIVRGEGGAFNLGGFVCTYYE